MLGYKLAKMVTSIRVDDDLWKKARIHAIQNDETMTDMVERLLKKEIERKNREGC
jgi:predicted transcriptional regulator